MLTLMQLTLASWSLAAAPTCEAYRPAGATKGTNTLADAVPPAPACASGH